MNISSRLRSNTATWTKIPLYDRDSAAIPSMMRARILFIQNFSTSPRLFCVNKGAPIYVGPNGGNRSFDLAMNNMAISNLVVETDTATLTGLEVDAV